MDAIAFGRRQSRTIFEPGTITSTLPETDQALLLQVGQQSRAAFEELYDRHCRMAMSIAMRILHDRTRADQVVLDAFWWLWKYSTLVECNGENFTHWLAGIVRNLAVTQLHRNLLSIPE